MVKLQAKYFGGYYDRTTYRLYTESGVKTVYEIDAFPDGRFTLDWNDRYLLSKTPYTERIFETLSDAVVYAERHLEKLRKADKVFKLNMGWHFPLTISEDEAKDYSECIGKPYWTVENPWKNLV